MSIDGQHDRHRSSHDIAGQRLRQRYGTPQGMAAVMRIAARWVNLMTSCLLAWYWQECLHLAERAG